MAENEAAQDTSFVEIPLDDPTAVFVSEIKAKEVSGNVDEAAKFALEQGEGYESIGIDKEQAEKILDSSEASSVKVIDSSNVSGGLVGITTSPASLNVDVAGDSGKPKKPAKVNKKNKKTVKATSSCVWPFDTTAKTINTIAQGRFKVVRSNGKIHNGVDFGTQKVKGVTAKAYRAGTVFKIVSTPVAYGKGYGGYGKLVIIKHSEKKFSWYAHLESIASGLKEKDKVKAGQKIGIIGGTSAPGYKPFDPHLHFEVRAGADTNGEVKKPDLPASSYHGCQLFK